MKKINKKLAAACILSVLCAGYSTIGFAAEEKEEKAELQSFALDEYVVTANRTEQTIFNANANISVVTKADIERMHYDTLDKALTAVPGVQFQNYSGGMLNSHMTAPIMINGSKNVLILVDGVRMTPLGSGDRAVKAHLLNNMDNVERIEVLKGSAGVLYGSDAAGGVINIITKKINENKTTLKATTGSFGKEAYHFSNSGTDNDLNWHVYYDKDRKGDFEDGKGNTLENYFDSHAAGIKLEQNIGEKHLLTFKYDESNADYRALGVAVDWFTKKEELEWQKGNVYTQETMLSHTWNIDDNTTNVITYRNGRILPTYDKIKESELTWQGWDGTAYKSQTISEQFTKVFDDNHTLIAGIDINKTEAGDFSGLGSFDNAVVQWNVGEIKNNSYFIQDTWTFDEKWNATAGLRYDIAEANKDGKSKDMDKNLSKSLNIAHNFDDRNNIYISYDEYFIIPTAGELFSSKYGNENLDPAKGKNISIGYNHIIDDKSNVSVHAFQRKADVTIGLTGDSSASQYSNFENSKDIGFDIQYNKRFDDKWNAFVGYSFLKHTSDEVEWVDRIKLGYLPRHSVNLGVNYTNDKWDIGLTGRGFLSRDDATQIRFENDTPNFFSDHYWIFNVGVNYRATENIKLFASANNIFDTYYSEGTAHGISDGMENSFYAMPGRSFVAGVEVSF